MNAKTIIRDGHQKGDYIEYTRPLLYRLHT